MKSLSVEFESNPVQEGMIIKRVNSINKNIFYIERIVKKHGDVLRLKTLDRFENNMKSPIQVMGEYDYALYHFNLSRRKLSVQEYMDNMVK